LLYLSDALKINNSIHELNLRNKELGNNENDIFYLS